MEVVAADSIWLTCSTLSGGTGAVSADGGAGNLPFNGGGGGGRISLNYTSNKYTGVLSAKGGTGYAAGGAGTIYSKAVNSANGMLIVDNGGSFGTNTLMDSTVGILTNLQVTGGASLIKLSFEPVIDDTEHCLEFHVAGAGFF